MLANVNPHAVPMRHIPRPRSEIFDLRCRNRVHAVIAATMRDVQFNHPLADVSKPK